MCDFLKSNHINILIRDMLNWDGIENQLKTYLFQNFQEAKHFLELREASTPHGEVHMEF